MVNEKYIYLIRPRNDKQIKPFVLYPIIQGKTTDNNFYIVDKQGIKKCIYNLEPHDEYITGDTKKQIADEIERYVKKMADKLLSDAEFIRNFEDEDDFLAHKLIPFLKNGVKRDEVLKVIKDSTKK